MRANELQQAMDKAKVSGLPEDAQAARDPVSYTHLYYHTDP